MGELESFDNLCGRSSVLASSIAAELLCLQKNMINFDFYKSRSFKLCCKICGFKQE